MALTIGEQVVLSVQMAPHGDTMTVEVFSQAPVLDGPTVVDYVHARVDVWPLLNHGQQVTAQQFYDRAVEKAT